MTIIEQIEKLECDFQNTHGVKPNVIYMGYKKYEELLHFLRNTNLVHVPQQEIISRSKKICGLHIIHLPNHHEELSVTKLSECGIKRATGLTEHTHKTAQERANRILELESIIYTIDSENDQLRETVRIQSIVLDQANHNAMRVPSTAMAAFILFIKMLFGGKA